MRLNKISKICMILILIIIISLQSATALRINEAMVDPKSGGEWIEIYGENGTKIKDWKIGDNSSQDKFSLNLTPKGYGLILEDDSNCSNISIKKESCYELDTIGYYGLKNTGEKIVLTKNGTQKDSFSWESSKEGITWQYCKGAFKEKGPTPGNKNNCSTTENNSASNNTENNQTNPNEEEPNNTTKKKNDSKNKTEENISLEKNGRPNSTEKVQKEETESKKQKDKIVLNNQQEKTEKEKTKDIKKDNDSSEDLKTGNFAKYGIGAFTILIGLLMILKSKIFGKKRKNEFQD